MDRIKLSESKCDEWQWKINANGRFSVKGTYVYITKTLNNLDGSNAVNVWNYLIPIKINVHVCRALQDRLPFKENLAKVGVALNDISCVLCKSDVESCSQLFFKSQKVLSIWKKSFSMVEVSLPQNFWWEIFMPKWEWENFSKNSVSTLHGVCCVVVWVIWR